MRFKTAVVALSFSAAFLVPLTSYADSYSIKLESVGAGDVFPYMFNVIDTTNHTTTTGVDLSCLNYLRDVSIGEQWQVNVNTLDDVVAAGNSIDGSSITQLEEDAYLDALYGHSSYSDADIQYAIWDILDPSLSGLDNTSKNLVTAAKANAGGETTAFLSQFTLYTPVVPNGDNNPTNPYNWQNPSSWNGNGEPQEFLEYTPSTPNDQPGPPSVPEPGSLALLGTGMLGMGTILHRRLQPVKA